MHIKTGTPLNPRDPTATFLLIQSLLGPSLWQPRGSYLYPIGCCRFRSTIPPGFAALISVTPLASFPSLLSCQNFKMGSRGSLLLGLIAAGLHCVAAVDQVVNAQLLEEKMIAPTRLDRLNLYPEDKDTVFDFYAQPGMTWEPGSVVNANRATFPYAAGNGMTMALLNLGPCSMLPPHYHPRATNYVVAINGSTDTYMIEENGARTVKVTLDAGKMTIFPAASIHTMENKGMSKPCLI